MAAGAFIPLLVYLLVAGGVGFRLIRLWRQTHQVPEGALGIGLAVIALGMPMAAAGRVPAIAMEPVGRALFAAGLLVNVSGLCSLVFFTYWVFRRGSHWGQVLLVALCVTQVFAVAYACAMNFTGSSVEEIKRMMLPGTVTWMAALMTSFLWGAAEAFHYRAVVVRQIAVGLGDPVIANRFLLWGAACATSGLLVGMISWCMIRGMTILQEPLPLGAMALAGAIMSATWYLVFFAPESYKHLVRERAAQKP